MSYILQTCLATGVAVEDCEYCRNELGIACSVSWLEPDEEHDDNAGFSEELN